MAFKLPCGAASGEPPPTLADIDEIKLSLLRLSLSLDSLAGDWKRLHAENLWLRNGQQLLNGSFQDGQQPTPPEKVVADTLHESTSTCRTSAEWSLKQQQKAPPPAVPDDQEQGPAALKAVPEDVRVDASWQTQQEEEQQQRKSSHPPPALTEEDDQLSLGSYQRLCEGALSDTNLVHLLTPLPQDILNPEVAGLRRLVESNAFETAFAVLIMCNMLLFGLEVQHGADCRCTEQVLGYRLADYAFNFLFVVELGLRAAAYNKNFFSTKNWEWNLLDSGIVLISVLEVILSLLSAEDVSGDDINLGHVRVMKAVRTFRIFRMLRLARHLRPLRILVHSILKTLRSLAWTAILVSLIMYLFAIVFTEAATQELITLSKKLQEEDVLQQKLTMEKYFGSVPSAMFVLFKVITGGLNWDEVSDSISHAGPLWQGMFIFYISFSIFALLNVVTGIFCQSAIESAAHDDDMVRNAMIEERSRYTKRLKKLVKQVDEDHSGSISINELEKGLRKEEVRQWFEALEIPVEDGWTLFQLLARGEDQEVTADDFVAGCLRLKGQAKAMHMLVLMNENRTVQHRVLEALLTANAKLSSLWLKMATRVSGRVTGIQYESQDSTRPKAARISP